MVEVVVTNPLPGQPRVVQAKCANDCPPGEVQLLRADDGSYVALSRSAAQKTSETTTRQVSRKNPTIPKKDEEFWPVTSCFLYSRIKSIEEDLTDNLATDLTSYDARQSWQTQNSLYDSTQSISWNDLNAPSINNTVFVQRSSLLGDYETAQDALTNTLKADRTFAPPSGSDDGGDTDNSAWAEGSENAVTAWFYIGDMAGFAAVDRNIFYARGNGYGNFSGPDYISPTIQGPSSPCMTMYGVGLGAIEALYASFLFGEEPLSKHLKNSSFPNLGGKIGYWGAIQQWHGMQDFADVSTRYDRTYSNSGIGILQPTSQPLDYPGSGYPAPPAIPWSFENRNWYKFGWVQPQTSNDKVLLNCSSEPGNIRVYNYGIDPFSSAAGFTCGSDIPGDNWSGYRLGNHSVSWMQVGNDSRKNGMFVCWQGSLANLGMASAFCYALQAYFNIDNGMGGVTLLGSCNPYGCKGPPGTPGNGYPKAPLAQRVVAKQFGHKAEIWLKVCDKEKPPIELKLPFEFAAVVTKIVAQNGVLPNGQTTSLSLITSGSTGRDLSSASECPHATMAVDKDFVYVDILYGGEREWAVPQIRPVPTKLSQAGSGTVKASDTLNTFTSVLGKTERSPKMFVVGEYNQSGKELYARYKADYFTYCQSFKIALPNSSNGNQLTIVASQRYRRGQTIQITEKSPDNEFNSKFLVCDFRTDMREQELMPSSPRWSFIAAGALGVYSITSVPDTDYASFGGLPALLQGRKETLSETLTFFNAVPKFYKPQSVWTDMDKIHFQLQESPRMIWSGNTVLPFGEFVKIGFLDKGDVILFDNNGKFGKHGRAAAITSASMFGNSNFAAPIYGDELSQSFLLYTSFKEQLIGNGLKNDTGLVVKWNRVSTSSFPIFGQIPRRDFSV